MIGANVLFSLACRSGEFIPRRQKMRKYIVAAVLIGAFATPALAVESGGGHYFVGLDTTSHKCSVLTEMAPGMKMIGEYNSQGGRREGHGRHARVQSLASLKRPGDQWGRPHAGPFCACRIR